MEKEFPVFKYHPNPIENGSFTKKLSLCEVCNQKTGYIYEGSIFTEKRGPHYICPWCVSSGEAAKKYNAELVDADPLIEEKIPQSIIDELTQRTPGLVTWQHPNWLTHCNDGCIYLGDHWELVPENDSDFWEEVKMYTGYDSDDDWLDYLEGIKSGHQSIYVFQCRHCEKFRGYTDFT
jgi:uncharacterized protein CbrC (UPF0167 family)